MAKFWVVRTGRNGERTDWSINNAICGGGWVEIPDLTGISDKEALRAVVEKSMPDSSKNVVSNYTGQLWALSNRIQTGDYLVLPIRSTSQLAIGKVTKGYEYRSDEQDESKRHVIGGVDWLKRDIPKSVIKQDLLYQLGSALTVFQVGNNDAEYRLEQVLANGKDPGSRNVFNASPSPSPESQAEFGGEDSALDLETISNDEVGRRIQEDFKGHALADLVAAVLEAEGFTCLTSPPGADGGVDVLAGKGPLGMDSPRIVVQVKSQMSQVEAPVLSQLSGLIGKFNADQALLVALGGITAPAQRDNRHEWFKIRVWTLQSLVENIYKNYDLLPSEIQARLPLKRIWVPVIAEG